MCGIVGLFLKNKAWQPDLGRHLAPMLIEMTDRGPDSAGVALYRNGVPEGWAKITLFHPDEGFDWAALEASLVRELGAEARREVRASHCVLLADRPAETLRHWLTYRHPEVWVMSWCSVMPCLSSGTSLKNLPSVSVIASFFLRCRWRIAAAANCLLADASSWRVSAVLSRFS